MEQPLAESQPSYPGDWEVTLHFVAKAGKGSELAHQLGSLGFEALKTLPGGQRVLLTARAYDVRSRLGVEVSRAVREVRVGPSSERRAFPIIPEGVQLPDSLGALVERVYTPTPPDRHVPRR